MNAIKLAGILCLAAGVAGLLYGSFTYTKDTEVIKLGPVELSVKEQKTVNVPMWAGVGAMVVGGALLLLGTRKS
jgi:TRAP-type C4-dicarboxylate transport system permease small subunit